MISRGGQKKTSGEAKYWTTTRASSHVGATVSFISSVVFVLHILYQFIFAVYYRRFRERSHVASNKPGTTTRLVETPVRQSRYAPGARAGRERHRGRLLSASVRTRLRHR